MGLRLPGEREPYPWTGVLLEVGKVAVLIGVGYATIVGALILL